MKKELTPQTTIAIVAVFAVLAVAIGWWWMNRTPSAPAELSTNAPTAPVTPPANAPTGANGSQGNTPLKPDV